MEKRKEYASYFDFFIFSIYNGANKIRTGNQKTMEKFFSGRDVKLLTDEKETPGVSVWKLNLEMAEIMQDGGWRDFSACRSGKNAVPG